MGMVIDVGVGDQGSPFLYSHFKNAYFISVDPLEEGRKAVQRYLPTARNTFVQSALGSADRSKITIDVSVKPSRTSLLQRIQHDNMSQPLEKREITIRTLDSVMSELGCKLAPPCHPHPPQKNSSCQIGPRHKGDSGYHPVLLKIDTEGYELECLLGAEETLKDVSYVLLEAPLTLNFDNSYTFSELIHFMANNQFEVFQILKAGNNNVDLLFCKNDDPLRHEWSYGNQKTIE